MRYRLVHFGIAFLSALGVAALQLSCSGPAPEINGPVVTVYATPT